MQMALFGNLIIPSDILNYMRRGGKLYRHSDDRIDLQISDGSTLTVDPDMFHFLVDERKIASANENLFGFYNLR